MSSIDLIFIGSLTAIAVVAVAMGTRAARDLGGYLWDRHERTLPAVEPARPADPGDGSPDGRAS